MKTKIDRLVRAVSMTAMAAFLMAGSAGATTITFNSTAGATGFNNTGLNSLNSSSGAAATLTYLEALNSVSGTPSNVNFGNFTLVCAACSTQQDGSGAIFGAFTFEMIITDLTDNATGRYIGTSSGGAVFSDVSQININWAPLQIGPGAGLTGSFGNTLFTINPITSIVAPNSGTVPGRTTIQGFVDTSLTSAVPEPATLSLIGGGLLAFGLLRRKLAARG